MTQTDTAPAPSPAADEVKIQVDYFGEVDDVQCPLPDGESWVTLRVLMEGERRKFLNQTNRDITISKGSGDAKLQLAPGDERYELLKGSIIGWNLVRSASPGADPQPVPFDNRNIELFLERVPPTVADVIEKKIREINPWLGSELSVEDIDTEIDRLNELRKQRVEEERGNSIS